MTEPIDPDLTKAIAGLSPPLDVHAQERRSQKLQEVSNLLMRGGRNFASDTKVFQPSLIGSTFELAALTWSGVLQLQHSTIPEISVKSNFSAKINDDNVVLSANDGEGDQELFNLPSRDVNLESVSATLRKYFEPRIAVAVNAYGKASTQPADPAK